MKRINEWRENENGSLTRVNEWHLTNWGEKALYILGWVWFVFILLMFVAGFISGAMQTS